MNTEVQTEDEYYDPLLGDSDVEAITGADNEIGSLLDDPEGLLGVVTAPPTLEKGVAMLAIATDQSTGEGRRSKGATIGTHARSRLAQYQPISTPLSHSLPTPVQPRFLLNVLRSGQCFDQVITPPSRGRLISNRFRVAFAKPV